MRRVWTGDSCKKHEVVWKTEFKSCLGRMGRTWWLSKWERVSER